MDFIFPVYDELYLMDLKMLLHGAPFLFLFFCVFCVWLEVAYSESGFIYKGRLFFFFFVFSVFG